MKQMLLVLLDQKVQQILMEMDYNGMVNGKKMYGVITKQKIIQELLGKKMATDILIQKIEYLHTD